MLTIDSHVHFWQPETLQYDWISEWLPEGFHRAYLPSDLRTAAGDEAPSGVVVVEAGCDSGPEAEVAWVRTLAPDDPPVVGIVAHAPVEQGEGVRPLLERLSAEPLVKGIRRNVQLADDAILASPAFIEGVRCLAPFQLSFDLCLLPEQIPAAVALVQACPDVQFILDHIGTPEIAGGQWEPWASDLARLAAFEHVMCKVSGVMTRASDLHSYLAHALEVFGPGRLLFGSDYPILNLTGTYPQWLSIVRQSLATLSSDEQHQVFYQNARSIYRLGPPNREQ